MVHVLRYYIYSVCHVLLNSNIPRKHVLFYLFRFRYPNNQTVIFERVVQTNLPLAVTFDSTNRHLYWTEDSPHKTIFRCDADGSNKTLILSASPNYPSSLTLDIYNRLVPISMFYLTV